MTTLRAVWEQKPEVPWLKKNESKEIGDGANTQLFQGALQQRQEKIRWRLVGGAGEGGEGQRRLWWWRSMESIAGPMASNGWREGEFLSGRFGLC